VYLYIIKETKKQITMTKQSIRTKFEKNNYTVKFTFDGTYVISKGQRTWSFETLSAAHRQIFGR
jgi:hypothetical protein